MAKIPNKIKQTSKWTLLLWQYVQKVAKILVAKVPATTAFTAVTFAAGATQVVRLDNQVEKANQQLAQVQQQVRSVGAQKTSANDELTKKLRELEEVDKQLTKAKDELVNKTDALTAEDLANLAKLQENIATTKKEIETALEQKLGSGAISSINQQITQLNADITKVSNKLEVEIDTLKLTDDETAIQLAGVPPIGSIALVADATLVNLTFYAPCEGATVGSYTFPTLLTGVFPSFGTPDGIVYPDSTAVNGLYIPTGGEHIHQVYVPGGTANTNNTGTTTVVPTNTFLDNSESATHDHTIEGDAITAPTTLQLSCFVRIK
jgi:hypothetical protein